MSARFLEDGNPRHLEDDNPRNLEDALAPDAASSSTTAGATSLTWAHTCATYGNRLLVVGVSLLNALGQTVTGVTYNSVALTAVPGGAVPNGTGGRAELWYLVAPATGANNIVASFSASVAAVGGAESWVAADQTTPLGTAATASGTTNDATVTVTSRVGQYVQDVVADAAVAIAGGAGQTEEWNTGVTGLRGGGSREAGAASVVMDWTSALSALWALAAVPIKPVSLAVALAGSTTGTATTTAAMKVAHKFIGSTTGTSSTTGALTVAHKFIGSTTGTATTTAAMKVAHSLVGIATGTSSATAAMKVAHKFIGAAAGTSSTTGTLSTDAPTPTPEPTGAGRSDYPNYSSPPPRHITRRTRVTHKVMVTSTWRVTMTTRHRVGRLAQRSTCAMSVAANRRVALRCQSVHDVGVATRTLNATAYRSGLAFTYPAEHNEDHAAALLLSLAD